MTPLAQLWHVFVKDVRQQRWLLLLYVLAVVVATGHALGWRALSDGVFTGTMIIVAILVILLVASVIQGDSPTRTDAFWATHPFDPYAVLGAKVLFALCVLGVAMIGQEAAIGAYGATSDDTARFVIHPALSLATVMLAAGVIASLTRDLRSFVLVAIVMPLLTVLAVAIATAYGSQVFIFRLGSAAVRGLYWAMLLLSAALIPWLYRTRDSRWQLRVAGYVIAGVAVVTTFMIGAGPSRPIREDATERRVPQFPLSLELPSESAGDGTDDPRLLTLVVVTPQLPEQLYLTLGGSVATLRFRDGSSAQLPLGNGYQALSAGIGTPTPSIPGVRWLTDGRIAGNNRVALTGRLTAEQREALDAGGATVAVEATVFVDTIEPAEPLPLVAGRIVKREGRRTVIEQWSHRGARPDIVVRSAGLERDDSFDFGSRQTFALLNRQRGEAMTLESAETNVSSDGLVLPITAVMRSTFHLRAAARAPGVPAPVDEDWYRDAELVPVSRRTLGSYEAKLTLTIPPR